MGVVAVELVVPASRAQNPLKDFSIKEWCTGKLTGLTFVWHGALVVSVNAVPWISMCRHPVSQRWIPTDDVEIVNNKPYLKADQDKDATVELATAWEKMSKSKYNGVDPTTVVGR